MLTNKQIKNMTFAELGEAWLEARTALRQVGKKNLSKEDVNDLENDIKKCEDERMRRWNEIFIVNAKIKAAKGV